MASQDTLTFSLEQQQVSGIFYNNSQKGIIIYTEDTDTEHEFYVKFYKRLLEGTGITIDKVIQLGNCDTVQQACQDDTDVTFPKLYVIDGDIYLQYAPKESQDRLCVLDRYCIENYLIDEETVCAVIQRFNPIDINEIKRNLNYSAILQEFSQNFIPIYYYYSLLSEENRKRRPAKTACFKHKKYTFFYRSSDNAYITANIEAFVSESRSELLQFPDIDNLYIDRKIHEKESAFPCCIETLVKIVSAKDDILPFLIDVIAKSFHISKQSLIIWKFNSADFYDTAPLNFLKDKIIAVYNRWKLYDKQME